MHSALQESSYIAMILLYCFHINFLRSALLEKARKTSVLGVNDGLLDLTFFKKE